MGIYLRIQGPYTISADIVLGLHQIMSGEQSSSIGTPVLLETGSKMKSSSLYQTAVHQGSKVEHKCKF